MVIFNAQVEKTCLVYCCFISSSIKNQHEPVTKYVKKWYILRDFVFLIFFKNKVFIITLLLLEHLLIEYFEVIKGNLQTFYSDFIVIRRFYVGQIFLFASIN